MQFLRLSDQMAVEGLLVTEMEVLTAYHPTFLQFVSLSYSSHL